MLESILILFLALYYIFTCACMTSYLWSITEKMTVAKAILFLILTLLMAPIYVTVLLGIKTGVSLKEAL